MLTTSVIAIEPKGMPRLLAEALESAVIFGELLPGSRVIEEEVAAQYKVSRSPVREAFRRLETDGLLVREDRKGVRVTDVSRRDLDEVYLCRLELESLAAREATTRWKGAAMEDFAVHLVAMEKAFQAKDIRTYFVANVAFTEAIHIAADNQTLRRLLNGISKQALRYRYLAYSAFPHLVGLSIEGNRELIELMRARDGDKAAKVMRELIERSWHTVRSCVADD
jgi:GntR family transcriptional regulator, rspAB operon transcriptional repressor